LSFVLTNDYQTFKPAIGYQRQFLLLKIGDK